MSEILRLVLSGVLIIGLFLSIYWSSDVVDSRAGAVI